MRIAVIGYASFDYVVRLGSAAAADRTATILSRAQDWPRLGGSPAYVCAALKANGVDGAAPVSWVGDEPEGARYRDALARLGLGTEGVGLRAGRTPVCILAQQPDGGCLCLYDPGLAAPPGLDGAQKTLIAEADALVATVGPAAATREALEIVGEEARVVWVVKADPRATPPELAAALATRADIVVHSRAEAAFVDDAFGRAAPRLSPLRLETRGAQGVAVLANGVETLVLAEPVAVEDATGAGDTWVGGFLAEHLARGAGVIAAARAANACVREMLAARAATEVRG